MRPANDQLEYVYEVVTAIPAIGARPGDELIVRPTDPDSPLTLHRGLGLDVLPVIPDAAVMFLASYEPESDVPVGHEADEAPRPALRLVRQVPVMPASPPVHRSTRITFDSDTIAEVWIATAERCPWCGNPETWSSARPQVDYRICIACRRGWQRCHRPHTPDNNAVFAQLVEQLAGAPRGG